MEAQTVIKDTPESTTIVAGFGKSKRDVTAALLVAGGPVGPQRMGWVSTQSGALRLAQSELPPPLPGGHLCEGPAGRHLLTTKLPRSVVAPSRAAVRGPVPGRFQLHHLWC